MNEKWMFWRAGHNLRAQVVEDVSSNVVEARKFKLVQDRAREDLRKIFAKMVDYDLQKRGISEAWDRSEPHSLVNSRSYVTTLIAVNELFTLIYLDYEETSQIVQRVAGTIQGRIDSAPDQREVLWRECLELYEPIDCLLVPRIKENLLQVSVLIDALRNASDFPR